MGGKVKKGTCKNRGYIGYHITWDNKKVFLRSKAEFVYARMLDIEKTPYMTECITYIISETRYKPDFFIFDSEYIHVKKIVEIKGLDDRKTAMEYLSKYKNFFNLIGIEYDVVWNYRKIITKYNLNKDVELWINKSLNIYDNISASRGKNNPMYGKTHKQSTIELIRKKALNRQTPEYRKQNSENQINFFKSEAGILRRKQISDQRKAYIKLNNPIINKKCKECNIDFESKLKSKKEFCNYKCLRKWSYNNIPNYGKHKSKLK